MKDAWLGIPGGWSPAEARSSGRRSVVSCAMLVLLGYIAVHGQGGNDHPWTGVWTLKVSQSSFGASLAPSISQGFTVVSQTLTLEQKAQQLRIAGETVYSDATGSHTAKEDNRLNLDGTPTRIGTMSLTLRRLDSSAFEIESELTLGGRQLAEVSRFAVSADGQTLTETKTQIDRSATVDADTAGDVVRRSRSVLIFGRRDRPYRCRNQCRQ